MAEQSLQAARTYSLRGRLLWLLLVAVALAALIQGAVTYYTASSEADEIFDYHMQQTAMALRGGLPFETSSRSVESDVEEANFDFVVQIWGSDGTPLFASTKREPLPRQTMPGFSELAAHGTRYRVFSMQSPTRIIQVAQDVAARRELSHLRSSP